MSGRGKGKGNKSPRRSPIRLRKRGEKPGVSEIASALGLDERDYRMGRRKDRTGEVIIRRNAQRKVRETIEGLQKEQREERLRVEEQERISDYPCDDQRCNETNNQCPWDQEEVNKLITLFLNPDAKETTLLRTKGTKRRRGGKRKKTVKRYSKNTKKK